MSWIVCCFFFFNDTATTEIYTLSLHDALPICVRLHRPIRAVPIEPEPRLEVPRRDRPRHKEHLRGARVPARVHAHRRLGVRSEEHTSELQSRQYLVCRLLLEKTKNRYT